MYRLSPTVPRSKSAQLADSVHRVIMLFPTQAMASGSFQVRSNQWSSKFALVVQIDGPRVSGVSNALSGSVRMRNGRQATAQAEGKAKAIIAPRRVYRVAAFSFECPVWESEDR